MNTSLLQPKLSSIIVRPLTANDAAAYRALRVKILKIGDGKYYSDSYTREQKLTTDEQWRNWCREKSGHCIIGTFIEAELVGVMMITRQEAIEGPTVEWEATWLDPSYRKRGIAKLSYQKVWEWTLQSGYTHVLVYVREDNARSREIREKQGFKYQGTKRNEVWADGSIADSHHFLLDLTSLEASSRKRIA